MNKGQEKKFLLICVGLLVIALAIVFVPDWWDDWQTARAAKKKTEEVAKIQQVGVDNNSTNNKIGVIVEGEGVGMEVDMSEALLVQDMVEGEGQEVKAGDTISIHYHGTLEDGTVFDSSVERGVPFEAQIGVGQLIQGWDEAIPGMKVGGKRRLTIPASKAYGDRAVGNIPPNSTLIFDVELLDIL